MWMNPLLESADIHCVESPLALLRKESSSVYNRLHSIAEDILFVDDVHNAYPNLPILPNLRCGAWYTNPHVAMNTPGYFKSTDGHYGNWAFNLRRCNLHLLPLLEEHNGMIIVDSTRSGKRIPDALSKTLPIWCAVVNRALPRRYPDIPGHFQNWDYALYTPPISVSQQEHHQIERRLDEWVDALTRSSFHLPLLHRPLRPMWLTPATSSFPVITPLVGNTTNFIPVICVSASQQISQGLERRTAGFTYVQGSGDDHELWGMGLTPTIFWDNKDALVAASGDELPGLIAQLVAARTTSCDVSKDPPSPILRVRGRIMVATLSSIKSSELHENTSFILLKPSNQNSVEEISPKIPTNLMLGYIEGKKGGSHFLSTVLPCAVDFTQKQLQSKQSVCIACPDGKDVSVCVAVAILQRYFSDDGEWSLPGPYASPVTKSTIRTRLEWVIESRPRANPSRAFLKRVNDFFLTPECFQR